MLKRLRYLAIIVLTIVSVKALPEPLFSSPLHFRALLAGNFGETRTKHFHSGIDIKTKGKEGKGIFAVGDGYISKVVENDPNIGNALFIQHPEGYVSIYCHLQRFIGNLHENMKKKPVAKGQLIAVSGNTGASEGPHLHLELRDARTDECLDPLDYIVLDYLDKQPPVLHFIKVYPQDTLSHFDGHTSPHIFSSVNEENTRQKAVTSTKEDWGTHMAWGKLAFSINAYDYMEGSNNKLGLHSIKCYVDNQLVFSRNMERFSITDHTLADLTCDQEELLSNNKIFIYTWFPSTLPLQHNSLYTINRERGIINIDHEKDYHLLYVLTDQQGNESHYTFTIKGQKEYKETKQQENEEKVEKRHHEPIKKIHKRKPYKRKHKHKRKNR